MRVDPLRELADRMGADPSGLSADHARWAVYSDALRDAELHPLVLEAVLAEADGALAASVVTAALEAVAPADRPTWVAALPVGERAYATRRSAELGVLDRVLDGVAAPDEVASLPDRTPWLQLRVAGTARDPAVLDLLESQGTTATRAGCCAAAVDRAAPGPDRLSRAALEKRGRPGGARLGLASPGLGRELCGWDPPDRLRPVPAAHFWNPRRSPTSTRPHPPPHHRRDRHPRPLSCAA